MQRNWIGRSEGTEMIFDTVCDGRHLPVTIFTTRADTVFGVTFMVLAPESELVSQLTSEDRREEVEQYVRAAAKKTERERISETKSVTGVFTGAYGINPLNGKKVPVWVSNTCSRATAPEPSWRFPPMTAGTTPSQRSSVCP